MMMMMMMMVVMIMMMVPDLKGGLEKITALRLFILFKAITAIRVPIE